MIKNSQKRKKGLTWRGYYVIIYIVLEKHND